MIRDLPDDRFRAARWKPPFRFAQNRSEWSGATQDVALPGGLWTCQLEHVPLIGESSVRPWRALQALLAKDDRRARIPATEEPQHNGAEPVLRSATSAGLVSITNMTITGGRRAQRSLAASTFTDNAARSSFKLGKGAVALGLPDQATTAMRFGLRSSPADSTNVDDFDAAWIMTAGGDLYAWNGATDTTTPLLGHFVAGGSLGLTVDPDGKQIRFWYNGALATSMTPANVNATYYLGIAFDAPGGISEVEFRTDAGGMTSVPMQGVATGTTLISAGCLATVRLINGDEQLVLLSAPLVGEAAQFSWLDCVPPLRTTAVPGAVVATKNPWCVMSPDDAAQGWGATPGQIYDLGGMAMTEAF